MPDVDMQRWRQVNFAYDIFLYFHITPEDITEAMASLTDAIGDETASARGPQEKKRIESEARICLAAYIFDEQMWQKDPKNPIESDPQLKRAIARGKELADKIRQEHIARTGIDYAADADENIFNPEIISAVDYIKMAYEKKAEAVHARKDPTEWLNNYRGTLRGYIETDGTKFVKGVRNEATERFESHFPSKFRNDDNYEGRTNFLTSPCFRADGGYEFDPSGVPHEELMKACDIMRMNLREDDAEMAAARMESWERSNTPQEDRTRPATLSNAGAWEREWLGKLGDIRIDQRGGLTEGMGDTVDDKRREILYYARILKASNRISKWVIRTVMASQDGEVNWAYIMVAMRASKYRPQMPGIRRDHNGKFAGIKWPVRGLFDIDKDPVIITKGKYYGGIIGGGAAAVLAVGAAWGISAIPVVGGSLFQVALVAAATYYGVSEGIDRGQAFFNKLILRNYRSAAAPDKRKLRKAKAGLYIGAAVSVGLLGTAFFVPAFPLLGFYALLVAPPIAGAAIATAGQLGKLNKKLFKWVPAGAAIYMAVLAGTGYAKEFLSPTPDDLITKEVKTALVADPQLQAVAKQITVRTKDGKVELTGAVITQEQIEEAGRDLQALKAKDSGILAATNSLTVAPASATPDHDIHDFDKFMRNGSQRAPAAPLPPGSSETTPPPNNFDDLLKSLDKHSGAGTPAAPPAATPPLPAPAPAAAQPSSFGDLMKALDRHSDAGDSAKPLQFAPVRIQTAAGEVLLRMYLPPALAETAAKTVPAPALKA